MLLYDQTTNNTDDHSRNALGSIQILDSINKKAADKTHLEGKQSQGTDSELPGTFRTPHESIKPKQVGKNLKLNFYKWKIVL